jgi:G:T-mismatch repair DNA endonuclease (very short patch repair protein)
MPSTNRSFWRLKIQNNCARDKRTARQLRRLGWSVFTVWECRLKQMSDASLLSYIQRATVDRDIQGKRGDVNFIRPKARSRKLRRS